jgi:hypothetical protein
MNNQNGDRPAITSHSLEFMDMGANDYNKIELQYELSNSRKDSKSYGMILRSLGFIFLISTMILLFVPTSEQSSIFTEQEVSFNGMLRCILATFIAIICYYMIKASYIPERLLNDYSIDRQISNHASINLEQMRHSVSSVESI